MEADEADRFNRLLLQTSEYLRAPAILTPLWAGVATLQRAIGTPRQVQALHEVGRPFPFSICEDTARASGEVSLRERDKLFREAP